MRIPQRKLLFFSIPVILVILLFTFVWSPFDGKERALQKTPASFAGSASCQRCHAGQHDAWSGSHHAQAIQRADATTILGNFDSARFDYHGIQSRFYTRDSTCYVLTDGPDGQLTEYPVRYTFGVYPLQQYLTEFPGGRLQALPLAWDARAREEGGQRWFHMYPDEKIDFRDQLHWTGPYQNWNMMCAECHSTALQKNWDPESATYHTTWQELSVGCESCHGPASRHITWAEKNQHGEKQYPDKGFTFSLTSGGVSAWRFTDGDSIARRITPRNNAIENVCAACHARSSHLTDGWNLSPGDDFMEHHRPVLLVDPLFWPTGEQRDEVYVWNSFQSSKMHAQGVTCVDCHNPHSGKILTIGNSLCGRCHNPAVFDIPAHYFHEPGTEGARCVNCHMPETTYMGVDDRRDHSFQVPRPDLAMATGSPDACTACHSEGSAWAAAALDKKIGKKWRERPHWALAFYEASAGNSASTEGLMAIASDNRNPAIVRASSLSYLSRSVQPEAIAMAQVLMKDPSPLVRAEAIRLTEPLDVRERWRLVNGLLSDTSRLVMLEAANVLADVPPQTLNDADRARWSRAVKAYEQLLTMHSDFPSNASQLGTFYLRRQLYAEAKKWLTKAIELDTQFEPGYVNLADLYRLQQRDDLGVAILRQGLEVIPAGAGLRYALALTLVRQGNALEAIELLKEATHLAPDNMLYAYVYAIAVHDKVGAAEGVTALKQALVRQPHNSQLLHLLIEWLIEMKRMPEARQYIDRYTALYPDDPSLAQWSARTREHTP